MEEVEIKFRVKDEARLGESARRLGFKLETQATHELNTLYDTPDRSLRQKGQLLRLRKYGDRCTITHKSRPSETAEPNADRHKRRVELEARVTDCAAADAIFCALGYVPCFTYEKFRAEWSDGEGQLVVDETPLGTLAELEGSPTWIDRVAAALGVSEKDYMVQSYGALFGDWQRETGSIAQNMTYAEMGVPIPKRYVTEM